jgi:hypothetical protein
MPYLKAVYEAFGHDARFVMINLSLDKDVEAPRKYADENGLGWTQGFVGEPAWESMRDGYGMSGIPAIFLIGPDGKVIARSLRGEDIKAAVAKALGKE